MKVKSDESDKSSVRKESKLNRWHIVRMSVCMQVHGTDTSRWDWRIRDERMGDWARLQGSSLAPLKSLHFWVNCSRYVMSTIETIVLWFSLCPPTCENYKISQQNIMSTEARFLSPCQAINYIALHCIVEVPVPVCGLAKYCIIFASVNTRSNPRSLAHNSPTPNSKLPHLGPFPHLSLPLIASLDLALTFKLPSFSH